MIMLQPARDRLDYSQIVIPPGGYRFEAAVGTTYSLDLAALLGIPIALVLGQSPDERLRRAGIPLLEALRKTAGKIALFCQAGRIAVPHEQRELYALLEKSIAQVLPPRDYSFHPKVWVIKYVRMSDKSDALFRVIELIAPAARARFACIVSMRVMHFAGLDKCTDACYIIH